MSPVPSRDLVRPGFGSGLGLSVLALHLGNRSFTIVSGSFFSPDSHLSSSCSGQSSVPSQTTWTSLRWSVSSSRRLVGGEDQVAEKLTPRPSRGSRTGS